VEGELVLHGSPLISRTPTEDCGEITVDRACDGTLYIETGTGIRSIYRKAARRSRRKLRLGTRAGLSGLIKPD
jgi:hypothetical protein